MQVETLKLSGLLLITPRVFGDERGWFYEPYNREAFAKAGITTDFMQDNHSRSVKNTLRGLHFQTTPGQAKLVRCTQGEIWDVAVDVRPESPTCGQWEAVTLSADKPSFLYIPIGFAHGFCVISENAEVQYKVSSLYNPATETGIAWNDPEIAVQWPVTNPLLSARDQGNQSLAEYLKSIKG